jgi:hypothetical protein
VTILLHSVVQVESRCNGLRLNLKTLEYANEDLDNYYKVHIGRAKENTSEPTH